MSNIIDAISKEIEDAGKKSQIFVAKTMNEWLDGAKEKPIPRNLFSSLWNEGETCILFASTGKGKTILATQIAHSITSQKQIADFALEIESEKLLYLDFELSDIQVRLRYCDEDGENYRFDDNFIRVEMNPDAEIPNGETYDEHFNKHVESIVVETGAKILIVDNITYLHDEMEKAKDAIRLMKRLKKIKLKYGLTMLVLAHTPKRDETRPITANDLAGSRQLLNFCDSCFAIGGSQSDESIRYVKQIKARNTAIEYSSDNVAVFNLDKEDNFTKFHFRNFSEENIHLKIPTEDERDSEECEVVRLHHQGLSNYKIAKMTGINAPRIARILKRQEGK